jgi:TrmH family RNA methyltransferase
MSDKITSLQNPIVKLAASLHLKKYRDETKLFLVEGQEMIALALKHEWELHHLFELDKTATPEILAKITKKDNPQSHVAIFHQKEFQSLPTQPEQPLLGLEEIRDPGNLGTILRSCHAVGMKQLLLIGDCCDAYAPETIRASMGSFAAVTILHCTGDALTQSKHRLIGTDVVNATDYRSIDYTKAIIVLGNEQKGLSPTLKQACHENLHIPMPGGTESLNVAMAATLIAYQTVK